MQLIVKKPVLLAMVDKAAGIVTGCSKDIQPVLKNFHFEVQADPPRLRIVSTDMDLSVISETKLVEVVQPGEAIIPAKKFQDIVKEVGDVDIKLSTTEDVAEIQTPITKWCVQLMKDKYPKIPEVSDVKWIKIQAEPFVAGLKKARLAVAAEDVRPELSLIKCGSAGIFATDGGRLHHAKISIGLDFELRNLAVDDLIRLMRFIVSEEIAVADADKHILFEIGNDVFIATKATVVFPSVTSIVESIKNNGMELQVSKSELISAIKRTRITADEETNRIGLNITNNRLSVETRDKQNNSCSEVVDAHWVSPPISLAVNWKFLMDAIQEMEGENVVVRVGQDIGQRKCPLLVEEPNFVAIINQIRVLDENFKSATN